MGGSGIFTGMWLATRRPIWAAASVAVTGCAFASFNALSGQFLSMSSMAPSDGPLNPQEFTKFKLGGVETLSHNTKRFRFVLADEEVLNLPVASCLVTRASINNEEVIRPYTPTSTPRDKGFFDLVVKAYPEGKMSRHIFSLQPGDELEMKGPITKIPYVANMKKEIGMIAGGTGITPMFQVLQEIAHDSSDTTRVSLIFANVSPSDILLKDELDALAAKHPNISVHYVIEKDVPADWTGSVGYITDEIVDRLIPKPSPDTLVMVCGPPPMMKAISGSKGPNYTQGEVDGVLKRLGYSTENVFKF
eukprot:c7436_g1_i1.p1 GENE.c7436_g1_i1~~c7436_g1_i1.p1  ORF type:complete len:305 (-),score=78.74 c7436_g1_i1:36-950(-)